MCQLLISLRKSLATRMSAESSDCSSRSALAMVVFIDNRGAFAAREVQEGPGLATIAPSKFKNFGEYDPPRSFGTNLERVSRQAAT